MSALAALSLFLVISSGLSFPEKDTPKVRPEYLDHLLQTEQYDLFADIMKIPDVNMVRPTEGERNENPMFNKDLPMGDIMPFNEEEEEEARQGINFGRHPSYQWPNRYIPYFIANQFSSTERQTIENSITRWNNQVGCLKLRPYNGEADYVYVFNGQGCWSYLGRIGGEQSLSLQRNGCVYQGTVLHEFQHAAGFAHEQNRLDRDTYIEMLWDNIPDDWKSQYQITNSRDFGIQNNYDYYSIMHYPVNAPGTNRPAFRVKSSNVDERRIGRGNDFTGEDIGKINALYC